MVGSTPKAWYSKRHTPVHKSTFEAESIAFKNAVEEAVMLRYHLWYMGVKVTKQSPIFVDNMRVVLNAKNPGSSPNNKTLTLRYNFVIEHVVNYVVELRKMDKQ